MLVNAVGVDCTRLILSMCDPLTIEVLKHTPSFVSTSVLNLDYYSCRLTGMCEYDDHEGRPDKCGVSDWWFCSRTAADGHLELLRWAHERGYGWDKSACDNAARGGHLEVLKWLRENGCPL